MVDEDTEIIEFYTQMVDSVEDKVQREASAAKERLNDIMHKIGDTLLVMRVEEEKSFTEEEITNLASRLGFREGSLVGNIVRLVEALLRHEYSEKEKMVKCAHDMEITDGNLIECGIAVAEDILKQADTTKKKMVTRASQLGIEKETLIERVAELVEANIELVRKVYRGEFPPVADGGSIRPSQIDEIPYAKMCLQALKSLQSTGDHEMRVLAILARTGSSTDRDMILNCCGLVVGMCTLENEAVTEYKWNGLEESADPGGMIGHTYNILRDIDEKIGKEVGKVYAQKFKEAFQGEADRLFNEARELRKGALCLIRKLPKKPTTPTEQQAKKEKQAEIDPAAAAATYLKDTVDLLKGASKLLFCASKFVGNPEKYDSSKDCIS